MMFFNAVHVKVAIVAAAIKEDPMNRSMLTLNDVARTLNCTVSCVRRWRREGRIAVVKLGKLVRVPESELDRIAKEGLGPVAGRSR
jgi:excisionase family DNA binding protein